MSHLPLMARMIGFSGSRRPSSITLERVRRAVSSVLATDALLVVGCAVGVDAAVIRQALERPERLLIFAAFGREGVGTLATSAVQEVQHAEEAGATVCYLDPEQLAVPVRARLVHRSLKLVRYLAAQPDPALVAFPPHPPRKPFASGAWPSCGSGTWATVAAAARLGVPVLVFPSRSEALPTLPGGGEWQRCTGFRPWPDAYRWHPASV